MLEPRLQAALEFSKPHLFRDWPNQEVPRVAAGVYTVWNAKLLLYAGMSGRGLTVADLTKHRSGRRVVGLFSRLDSHASGRRSGDQFCVYVSDRLVLPSLVATEIAAISRGESLLDALTKKYIHEHLSYRWVEVEDGATAARVEAAIKSGALSAGKPLLNPH